MTRQTPRGNEPLVQKVFCRWGSADILILLRDSGEKRFSEICRDLPELSEQIISTRLADLREIGMVDRYVRQDRPIAVDYSLTEAGRQLAKAASTIRELSLTVPVRAA